MNHILQVAAKKYIIDNIYKLPFSWQDTFKLLYARKDGKRSVDAAMDMSFDDILKEMSDDKLECAMGQIERSLIKLNV